MRVAVVVFLIACAAFSCSNNVVEKRGYTEKDIEGYWATNSVMQSSPLTRAIAAPNVSANEITYLRFYNDVCGVSDSAFKVNGDIISIRSFDLGSRNYEWVATYRIKFVSTERIILSGMHSTDEMTFYSLLTLPATNVSCNTFEINYGGGPGIIAAHDSCRSVYTEYEDGRIVCFFGSRKKGCLTDSTWFSRMNSLYARIDRSQLLFASEIQRPYRADTLFPPPFYSGSLIVTRASDRDIIGNAANLEHPCVRALYEELWRINAMFWE